MSGMKPANKIIYARQAEDYALAKSLRVDEQAIINDYFRGKSVLILGCGAGRTIRPIHNKGFEVTAVDIVPEMVERAKASVSDLPVNVLEMDATKLKFDDNCFDIVFFPFHGIDYVDPDIYAAVKEVSRVLKDEGVFIFSSHNRLFLKKLHRFFVGSHDTYRGLYTYRTSPCDYFKLKKIFADVLIKQRIMLMEYQNTNWKDKMYRLVPWLNKSTYFICSNPINHD